MNPYIHVFDKYLWGTGNGPGNVLVVGVESQGIFSGLMTFEVTLKDFGGVSWAKGEARYHRQGGWLLQMY